ncbi:BTAD domain-containing putative transcriptional regulator [Streptomyces sp. NPDC026672]|uniref:AfsR/SARP family transcriptional regulator n=1 Tax=Streptomyces sp. NPDC026672 TaxID=3155252 RepID=UPI0033FC2415
MEIVPSTTTDPIRLRAAKIRVVLAALLVRANEIVSVEHLIDELWGENPPRTATTTLQVYISQVRKLLDTAEPDAGRDALITRQPGYMLNIDPAQLDLTVFEELYQKGQAALQRGEHAVAADLLSRALQLWRAPLACDTPHGTLLTRTAVRLAEVRAAALEQRIRAELELGHHQRLIGELHNAVAEMPLREEFHTLLMTALYRAGRQVEALRVFAQLRRDLISELGIEPGHQLQELHRRILAGDSELLHAPAAVPVREPVTVVGTVPGAVAAAAVPHDELEGPPPGLSLDRMPERDRLFVGRADELDRLSGLLHDVPTGGCVVVAGPAGVGKSALALAAAHELSDRFPDGRIFVELGRGAPDGTHPADPAGPLPRLLRQLGVKGPLPSGEERLRRVLRRLTENRRVLLILDGVEDAERVRPLLPETPGSTTLVTCRQVPTGLTDRVLELGMLSHEEARQLIDAAAGRPLPPCDDRTPVREIVALCGGLPLALRAAAARLASRPNWDLETLATRLRDEHRRMSELTLAFPAFRYQLYSGYEQAEPELQRAFRLLGLIPEGPFGPRTAAAVLGEDVVKTGALLDDLARAQLLNPVADGPEHGGTHRLHPLWRLMALECLAAESPQPEAREATSRLAAEFTRQLREAYDGEGPDGPRPEWFGRCQDGLVDVVRRCHEAGLWEQTIRLSDAMTGFLEAMASWDAWDVCHTLALEAAQRQEDLAAEARLLRSLGDLAWQRQRLTTAGEFYERALLTADAAPAAVERGRALVGLADLHLDAGGLEEAAALLSPALEAVGDDPRGRYETHRVLGLLALENSGPETAAAHFGDCLEEAAALRDPCLESYAQRLLDRVRGNVHPPEGWSEVRPGVWRLVPCSG